MRVLITGASGQVGHALQASAPAGAQVRSFNHNELDIGDPAATRAAVTEFRPDLIFNAAAYTAVDQAEREPEHAHRVNALGPRHLAEAALPLADCRLIHVSTDYVFDGLSAAPYRPDAPTNPLGVYGRTKLQGERFVLTTLPERAAVLRTAWVYAARGKNFLLTMLRLMRERGAVRVVADQIGTPTAADSVARALWRAAERPLIVGILHWTDAGSASWYDFACAIAADGHAAGLLAQPAQVTAIGTTDYPTAARRPANSRLDCSGAEDALGLTAIPWRESLRATLAACARP